VIAEQRLGWGDGFRLFEHLRKRAPRALLFLFARKLPAGIATLAIVHGLSAYLTKSSAGFLELPRVVRAAMQQARAVRQEEAVARVVEQLSIGVLILTREGAVRVANGAAARLLGLESPAEMVGLPLDTWGPGLAISEGWLALLKGQRRLVEHVFPRPGTAGESIRLGVWQARGPVPPGDAYYGVVHRIRAARGRAEPPA
jgi:PAS domain-containing protein